MASNICTGTNKQNIVMKLNIVLIQHSKDRTLVRSACSQIICDIQMVWHL